MLCLEYHLWYDTISSILLVSRPMRCGKEEEEICTAREIYHWRDNLQYKDYHCKSSLSCAN